MDPCGIFDATRIKKDILSSILHSETYYENNHGVTLLLLIVINKFEQRK